MQLMTYQALRNPQQGNREQDDLIWTWLLLPGLGSQQTAEQEQTASTAVEISNREPKLCGSEPQLAIHQLRLRACSVGSDIRP